jgi:DNA-binding MarR family transcriptional regulator
LSIEDKVDIVFQNLVQLHSQVEIAMSYNIKPTAVTYIVKKLSRDNGFLKKLLDRQEDKAL